MVVKECFNKLNKVILGSGTSVPPITLLGGAKAMLPGELKIRCCLKHYSSYL